MKLLKNSCILVILLAGTLLSSNGQETKNSRTRTYKTWVSLKENGQKLQGILMEIKDSSLIISNSLSPRDNLAANLISTGIPYNDIYLIKTRRIRNIERGTIIGGVSGFGFGAISAGIVTRGLLIISAAAIITGGLYFGALGAGTGALAGSIKDRFLIKSNYDNFNRYRSVLQEYSFQQEYPAATTVFQHKGFVGFDAGPSFPIGDFGNTGYSGNFFAGYRFSKYVGITVSDIYNEFSVNDNLSDSYWSIGGIMIEPMLSIPLRNKFYVDLKPGIGYANAYMVVDDVEKKNGNGVGLNLNTCFTFNLSKRWGLSTRAGYFYTDQKFEDNTRQKFKTINLDLGIMYKFSRKSL